VSPHPWGSHAAEGFRKSDSLDRIIFAVFKNVSNGNSTGRTAFSAGSHVLWTPVYVRPDGQIKYTKPISTADGWTEGWLASRSPPYRITSGTPELELDITSLIIDKRSSADPIEILYDNRFALTFHPRSIPGEVFERMRTSPSSGQRLLVTATKKYFLPRLTFRPSRGHAIDNTAIGGSNSGPDMTLMTNALGSSGTFVGADWAHWRLARLFE
jgi:tRNA(Ile)-lysidine synthase